MSSRLELRHASTEQPVFVVVPTRQVLAIDGWGHPFAADFQMATAALRVVSELLRAWLRQGRFAADAKPTLEVLWRTEPRLPLDRMARAFADRANWHWTQLLEIPEAATSASINEAIETARTAAGRTKPLVHPVSFDEDRAAQILHVGGLATEYRSVAKLCAILKDLHLAPRGPIHQLVLAHPDEVPIDRARSIFRIPIGPEQGRSNGR